MMVNRAFVRAVADDGVEKMLSWSTLGDEQGCAA
jgi:hypothetical protein